MAIPKIFNTFALNLNKITMDDLNRLKVVLVEQKKTGKWLAEQLCCWQWREASVDIWQSLVQHTFG